MADSRPETDERVFGVTAPIVVRQPLRAEPESVRGAVEQRCVDGAGTPETLLPDATVVTCSLFLDGVHSNRPGGEPALAWYLEVPRAAREWTAPAARLLESSPLFEGADRQLVDHGRSDVLGPTEYFVHGRLPGRPGRPDDPDVVLVTVPIEPGLATLAARGIDTLIRRLGGTWIESRMEAATREILEDERMWTETLWLRASEATDGRDGCEIVWFMEAASMAGVVDAYEASDTGLARGSAWVMDRIFAVPMDELENPLDIGRTELLVHLTDPDRP